MPRIGPWRGRLEQVLSAKARQPSRDRLTLIRVFEDLRGPGCQGGRDAVRRFARGWSQARGAVTAAAQVPPFHAPGEASPFDRSPEVVVISGVTLTVRVAHVRLCHSRMIFARTCPRGIHDRAA